MQFLPYMGYNSLRTLHLANYRCHRKITIVDGRIGYVGGMNLDTEQMPGTLWPIWRDTQVRFHGEAALALQIVFLAAWHNTTVEQIPDMPDYFPDVAAEVKTFSPVQITASGPDSQWHGIRQLYFYLIVSARKHVYIQSPFFVPDETIGEAMKAAALAGVDVRMICTPRGAHLPVPLLGGQHLFPGHGGSRREDLSLQRRLLSRQDRQHGLRGLYHRLLQHGHSQLQHQLRDQLSHLRRVQGPGTGGRLHERPPEQYAL